MTQKIVKRSLHYFCHAKPPHPVGVSMVSSPQFGTAAFQALPCSPGPMAGLADKTKLGYLVLPVSKIRKLVFIIKYILQYNIIFLALKKAKI